MRPTQPEDASFILELLNSPGWLKYIGDRNVGTKEDAEVYIRNRMLPQLERLGYSNCTVIRKSDGQKLGTCGLYDREGIAGTDIGFAFLPDYEGKGYANESAKAMLQAAFENFGLKSVEAYTTKENLRSQQLILKLGMNLIGTIQFPGEEEALLHYRLMK